MRAEPNYPPGLPRDELYALLRTAERQRLIEREAYRTEGRREGSRWRLTEKGRVERQSYAPGLDTAA